MKKLISFIIAAAVAATMSVPIYAEERNTADSKYSESVNDSLDILHALGLYDEYNEMNLSADKEIKRGEFAKFVGRLFKVSENNDESKAYYYDVPKSNYAFGAVNALTDMGIFDGTGDRMFLPDTTMTQDEATVVLIRALGYDVYANENGGFPTGYVNTAARLKLTSGISADRNLNMGDMLIMFKNVLEVDLPRTDFSSIEYPLTRGNGDDTFIAEYYDAYFEDGMVTAADKTYIFGMSNTDDDETRIDNTTYSSAGIATGEFLGEKVEFIYKDDDSDKKILLWIKQKNKDNVLYLTEPENDFSFKKDAFEVEYFKKNDSSAKSAVLAQNVSVIYNGEVYAGSLSELFDNFLYSIKLIKSNNSGTYDVIIVTGFYDVYVESVNQTDKSVVGKNGEKISLDEKDYDYLKICNAAGEPVYLSSIQKGTILSISAYGNRSAVYVSDEKVNGKISRSATENGMTKITINDTDYRVSDSSSEDKVKIGKTIVAYIDSFGYVAYVEVNKEDGFLAYIIKVSESDAWKYKLKAYNQYGEMKVYDIANKVKIDGDFYKGYGEIKNALGRFAESRIALCKINKGGEISYIDTTERGAKEDDSMLSVDCQRMTGKYSGRKFGKKALIDKSTTIMGVPENTNGADDSEYKMIKMAELRDDQGANSYTVETYKFNDDLGPTQVAVIFGYDFGRPIYWDTNVLVEDIVESVDENGDVVETLHGYKAAVPVQVYCRSDYKVSDFASPGDIVKLYTDNNGYLKNVDSVFKKTDADNGEIITNNDIGGDNRFITGYVTEVNGNIVKFGETKGGYSEIFNFTDKTILVYDENSRGDKVRVGTIADIDTYTSAEDDCSFITVQSAGGGIQVIVVYK